jgi:hypothetical protein
MSHSLHLARARRWLLPVLALFLVVGHACELPAFTAALAHHGDDPPAHGHAREHEAEMWCDPVDAVSGGSTRDRVGSGMEALPVPSAARPACAGPGTPAPARRWQPPDRPPLFVLHAALLI